MPKKKDDTAVAVRWEHDEQFDREVGYCEDGSVWGSDAPAPEPSEEPEPEPAPEPEPPAEPAPKPPK